MRALKAGSRSWLLEGGNVRGLQPLGTLGYFELNRLPFVQRFIPLRLNGGEVDEDVLAGLALNKSESLAGIEPLHCSLFSQLVSHFNLSYLMLSFPPPLGQQTQKGAASVDLQPLNQFQRFYKSNKRKTTISHLDRDVHL